MRIRAGDDITIDSERAGRPARHGHVLEVIEADYGTRYRVTWDDGRESIIHPTAGTIHRREIPTAEDAALADIWC